MKLTGERNPNLEKIDKTIDEIIEFLEDIKELIHQLMMKNQ